MTSAQVRAARGLINWTVRDLAEKAGVHRNTVTNIETGKYAGSPEAVAAIRTALGNRWRRIHCRERRRRWGEVEEMTNNEPSLVTSSKSMRVAIDGYPFAINIFRMDYEDIWTLEVVDQDGKSHVWEEQFESDRAARDAALHELETTEPLDFMRGSNIVPFSKA